MEQNQIINYKGGKRGVRVPNDVKEYIIKRVKEVIELCLEELPTPYTPVIKFVGIQTVEV